MTTKVDEFKLLRLDDTEREYGKDYRTVIRTLPAKRLLVLTRTAPGEYIRLTDEIKRRIMNGREIPSLEMKFLVPSSDGEGEYCISEILIEIYKAFPFKKLKRNARSDRKNNEKACEDALFAYAVRKSGSLKDKGGINYSQLITALDSSPGMPESFKKIKDPSTKTNYFKEILPRRLPELWRQSD